MMRHEWITEMGTKDYVAITSAVIAVCALGTSLWNAIAIRRHQKLSVRPHLTFSRYIQPGSPQVRISLKNNGLGTAIIESINVYLDGNDFPINRASHWCDLVDKLNKIDGDVIGFRMYAGEALRAGDSISLLEVQNDEDGDTEAIGAQFDRIRIVARYKSMYDEQFTEIMGKDEASNNRLQGTSHQGAPSPEP